MLCLLALRQNKNPPQSLALRRVKIITRGTTQIADKNPPPLRSLTTSMHLRSIHGKRLLGVKTFGTSGSEVMGKSTMFYRDCTTPYSLGKQLIASVFVNAFDIRFIYTLAQQVFSVNTGKAPKDSGSSAWEFLYNAQMFMGGGRSACVFLFDRFQNSLWVCRRCHQSRSGRKSGRW